jgi:hypothetical protein
MHTLWLHDASGPHPVTVSPPSQWHGETDCVIGPFSSSETAQTYVTMSHYSEYDRVLEVFVKGNAWYVSVRGLA